MTRRTVLRKAFLGPWDPLVDDIILYAMADAQRATGVAIHDSVRVVSHMHTTGTPCEDNLPDFTRRFHHDVSCGLHTLLCARKYDAPRELFDDRPTHMMRLVDAEAQASHGIYEVLNPVAAGLVKHPDDMPMKRLDYRLWKKGYIEVERPPFYFDSSRPKVLELRITPPPLLYEAFGGDLDKLVYHLEKLEKDGLAALHRAMSRPFMGAQAVRRIHPWSEPRTLREPGGQRVPCYRIGASGILGREARIESSKEVTQFRHTYDATRVARRDGDHERLFPYGTYGARVYHGAPIEGEPWLDAIVTAPGPTLDEVKERLARERPDTENVRERSHALVHAVRNAVRAESSEIVEDTMLDLTEPTIVTPRGASVAGEGDEDAKAKQTATSKAHAEAAGQAVVVRQRFDKRRDAAARRIITLRDRRRGRPPRGGTGTHGSDPPG